MARKIFDPEQLRQLDRLTIDRQYNGNSYDLIEHAARRFTRQFLTHFNDDERPVLVLCGPGNNGGDGFAVARMLVRQGFPVQVWTLDDARPATEDARLNHKRWRRLRESDTHSFSKNFPEIDPRTIVIDALLGSGLSRPVTKGSLRALIRHINGLPNTVVSVDLPSGVFADQPVPKKAEAIRADRTISFQAPKLSFFFPETADYLGEWELADIGLNEAAMRDTPARYHYQTAADMRQFLKPRGRFDHKGSFGHVLSVAGSFGKMGAALLCGRGALRVGAGLVTLYVPRCGYEIAQIGFPEAMVLTDPHLQCISEAPTVEGYRCVAIGPGLGTGELTERALGDLLKKTDRPVVLDADALNLLARHPEWFEFLPKNSILTPHPKEFQRLFGSTTDSFEQLKTLQEATQKHELVIVLKGGRTAVAEPDGTVTFNMSGNPGMGTGGTGDVLTGMIAGLLAQGYEPVVAARLGVFLHGAAGDRAREVLSQESLLATDVLRYIGSAFARIREQTV